MELLLNEQEQQLLKNVLHALYKSFKKDEGLNSGTSRCSGITANDLKMIIAIHDRIVYEELNNQDDTEPELKEALAYVREQLDEDDLVIIKAKVSKNLKNRCSAWVDVDYPRVEQLLFEYGEQHDLITADNADKEWWEKYGDIDFILEKL